MCKYSILTFILFLLLSASNELMAQRFRLEENGAQMEVKFDAYKVNNTVQFVWNTNNENNITSYEIMRGDENGRFIDWITVAVVRADKSNQDSYTFVDETPKLGEMQYRLKIIAPDGSSVEYSPLYRVMRKTSNIETASGTNLARNR